MAVILIKYQLDFYICQNLIDVYVTLIIMSLVMSLKEVNTKNLLNYSRLLLNIFADLKKKIKYYELFVALAVLLYTK